MIKRDISKIGCLEFSINLMINTILAILIIPYIILSLYGKLPLYRVRVRR